MCADCVVVIPDGIVPPLPAKGVVHFPSSGPDQKRAVSDRLCAAGLENHHESATLTALAQVKHAVFQHSAKALYVQKPCRIPVLNHAVKRGLKQGE